MQLLACYMQLPPVEGSGLPSYETLVSLWENISKIYVCFVKIQPSFDLSYLLERNSTHFSEFLHKLFTVFTDFEVFLWK